MASESVCRACGSTAGHEYQTRCDGCGELFDPDGVRGDLILPGVENYFDLCAPCKTRTLSAASGTLLHCDRCGHFRPEHNKACLRILGPDLEMPGAYLCCECPGWVEPEKEKL